MENQKVWFITGASRGFGLEITKAALIAGDKGVATVRGQINELTEIAADNKNLHVLTLDVANEAATKTAAEAAIEKFGKIDVLVNNAGFGLLSAIEEGTDMEIRKMYDTNVFGLLHVTRAILPYMRARKSGHVINISSVGGLASAPGWGLYASTKFALEGITEAMADELKALGIFATVVEPGYFRTNFLDGSSLTRAGNIIDDYAGTVGQMREFATQVSYKQPGDPVKLAAAIIKLAASENPPVHLPLGRDTLAAYRAKTAAMENDIASWETVVVNTDHDDVAI